MALARDATKREKCARAEELKLLTRRKTTPADDSSGYVLDEQIGFRLRLAMQRHTAIFMARIPDGLTQTQFAALAKLHEVEPCSQNQLGRLISLDAATIKGVVDRLHVRGFVTMVADPNDKRRRAIMLTAEGRRATEAAEQVAAAITEETMKPLTPEEQRTVVRLLKKLS